MVILRWQSGQNLGANSQVRGMFPNDCFRSDASGLSYLGMSASPPTPDVSLRGSEPTLRAKNQTCDVIYQLVRPQSQ